MKMKTHKINADRHNPPPAPAWTPDAVVMVTVTSSVQFVVVMTTVALETAAAPPTTTQAVHTKQQTDRFVISMKPSGPRVSIVPSLNTLRKPHPNGKTLMRNSSHVKWCSEYTDFYFQLQMSLIASKKKNVQEHQKRCCHHFKSKQCLLVEKCYRFERTVPLWI